MVQWRWSEMANCLSTTLSSGPICALAFPAEISAMSKKASCLYSCCLVCCASVLACGPADNANGDTPENMDPQGSGGGGGTGANPGSGGNGTGGGVPAGGPENGTGGVGDLPEVECEISATSELSPVIGTVGIVQWSTTLEG